MYKLGMMAVSGLPLGYMLVPDLMDSYIALYHDYLNKQADVVRSPYARCT